MSFQGNDGEIIRLIGIFAINLGLLTMKHESMQLENELCPLHLNHVLGVRDIK